MVWIFLQKRPFFKRQVEELLFFLAWAQSRAYLKQEKEQREGAEIPAVFFILSQ